MTLLNWPLGKRCEIKTTRNLLDALEVEGIISENNYQSLVDILEKLSLFQASSAVRKYMPPQSTPHYSVDLSTLERFENLQITRNDKTGSQMFQSMHQRQYPDAKSMNPMAWTHQQKHPKEEAAARDSEAWRSYKEKFYMKSFIDETAKAYHFFPNELNVVLIGKTGSGKSATGNTLVGREHFEEGEGVGSHTKTISLCSFREGDTNFTVIDTPGLFDTEGDFTNEEMILEIVKTMIKFCRGIHLFLLVFHADMKYTSEERQTVSTIETILSNRIYDHCVIVLTRAKAKFGGRKKTKSLTNFIAEEKQEGGMFAHLVAKVGDRVVAVENDFEEDDIIDLQRQTFRSYLMAVVSKKKDKCFSTDLFRKIDQKIKKDELDRKKRIQKAEQLTEMEYRVERFLFDYLLESLTVENLGQIYVFFEQYVDHIKRDANITHLNHVGRNDVVNFLKKFATENKSYIERLSQMKLRERWQQAEQKKRDETNSIILGEKLPNLLKDEPDNRLQDFTVCLEYKDLTRVNDLLSKYAQILSATNDVTNFIGDIYVFLQTYCLTFSDSLKEKIQNILEKRAELKRIEEKRILEEKRNRALAKISAIIDDNLNDYLTGKNLEQLKQVESQIQNNQVPADIFQEVKKKLSNDDVAYLDDASIVTEIFCQLSKRKGTIDDFKKKAGRCFAGSVLVHTKTSGSKCISAVKVNDDILVFDSEGNLFYEKVYIISHANATQEVLYVRIATREGKVLFISPHHILPIGGLSKNIPAKDVIKGDTIFTINNGVLTADVVTSVSYKTCKGAFCPMTMNGTIVVNDVAASCYTTFVNPFLAHVLLSPFRIMFKCIPTSIFNTMLLYDSVDGMPLTLSVSRAAVNFIRPASEYLKLL